MRLAIVFSVMLCIGEYDAQVAVAAAPDPACTTVHHLIVDPGGYLPYVVEVKGGDGCEPCPAVEVTLTFDAAGDGFMCWCTTQEHPVISATTDAEGKATFYIAAGGCLDPADGLGSVEVAADGVVLATVGAISPDVVDNASVLPPDWDPGDFCAVRLTDAVWFTPFFRGGAFEFCTDFNQSGTNDLGDLVIISPPIKRGDFCAH